MPWEEQRARLRTRLLVAVAMNDCIRIRGTKYSNMEIKPDHAHLRPHDLEHMYYIISITLFCTEFSVSTLLRTVFRNHSSQPDDVDVQF